MTNDAIIRAWKDQEYRSRLSDAERAMLPANPVGMVEISDHHLDSVDGGSSFACGTLLSIATATFAFSCFHWCSPAA